MWILWKMIFSKCEFYQKWDFQKCENYFFRSMIFWIKWGSVFAPVCVCFSSILAYSVWIDLNLILRKYVCGQMRLLLKKGSKTLRNLPSIWPGFHAIFFWPKLECVRRLAFLSVFCQSAIWCIEQSIHYDLKNRKKKKLSLPIKI